MKRMTTLKNHERRITTLEDRVGDIETSHGRTLYELTRFKIKTGLQLNKVLEHFDIGIVTEEEVDEALDAE